MTLDSTLVLCDLDNLLLNEENSIPQVLRDVLQLFGSRGGKLTVFSQRSPRAVRTILGGVRLGAPALVCGGTLAWMLGWKAGLVAWGLFAALWLLSKYVSLGSIFAGISLTVSVFLFYGHNWLYTALAFVISVLVVWCHRENIDRLLHGTERKFQWHSGPPKE